MEIDDEPMEHATLRHCVVRFYSDLALETGVYKKLGQTLFEENKALIVCEGNVRGASTHEHCHIQGYSRLSDNQFKVKAREILKPVTPSHMARPLSHKQGDVTELGFQYMCKEYPPKILYQNLIDDDEIEALADASKLLLATRKAGLGQALQALHLDARMGPAACFRGYMVTAIKYYLDQEKLTPPNLKHLVKNLLYKLAMDDPAWIFAVSEL